MSGRRHQAHPLRAHLRRTARPRRRPRRAPQERSHHRDQGERVHPHGALSHPKLSAADATHKALAASKNAEVKGSEAENAPRLVVWAGTGKPVLAWETVVEGVQQDGTPSELQVVADASQRRPDVHRQCLGQRLNGTWKLRVQDRSAIDVGYIRTWRPTP